MKRNKEKTKNETGFMIQGSVPFATKQSDKNYHHVFNQSFRSFAQLPIVFQSIGNFGTFL